ncbi:hypothetical protein MHYP_G00263360 [Metynnis hypsauchen]
MGEERAVSAGEDEERTCGDEEQWRSNGHKLMKIFTLSLRVEEWKRTGRTCLLPLPKQKPTKASSALLTAGLTRLFCNMSFGDLTRAAGSVMPFWSSALRVLILLTITFIPVSESANPSVTVKFNETATLPCSERCSGLVIWTVFTKPTDPLAECDQTSCRSVKEGYQMIHDQYLKGDLSLIITAADLTKRNWYTCACDGKDLCDVTLKIEPLNTKVQKKPGESLFLDLHIPEEVEMIYNSTGAAGPSSGQICTVVGRSLQCKPEYEQRTSLASTFVLRAVTPSDSGVYTVMDKKNEEAVHTYTVTIEDGGDGSEAQRQVEKPRFRRSAASDDQPCQGAAVPVWLFVLSLTVCGVLSSVIGWMWGNKQLFQKKCGGNGMKNHNEEETMSL